MIVYKEKEKFKAEVCKHLAYFLASISGLMIIRMAVYGENINNFINLQGLLALASWLFAYILMGIALSIYHDLDYKLSKLDDKIDEGVSNG